MRHIVATFLAKFTTLGAAVLLACNLSAADPTDDLYIFAGQSNMYSGVVQTCPPELAAIDDLLQIWGNPPGTHGVFAWVPLQNGVNNNASGAPGFWGPEAELTHRLHLADPTRTIHLVKFSVGGTHLHQGDGPDWNAASKDEYLDQFLAWVVDAQKHLDHPQIKAFVWMQGEADTEKKEYADAYQSNLTALIAKVRTVTATPALPVYIGRIRPQPQPHWDYADTVRSAETEVCKTIPACTLIDTDPFHQFVDHMHLDSAGQIAFGDAIYDAMSGAGKTVK